MKQTTIRCAIRGVAFPSDPVSAPSWPAAAAQHGIFAIKMIRGWNIGVNVQGTLLRAVASSVPSVRVTS